VPTRPPQLHEHGTAPAGTIIADPADATQRRSQYVATRLAAATPSNAYLIPAGHDQLGFDDRPIRLALLDALNRAQAAVLADTTCQACRNTCRAAHLGREQRRRGLRGARTATDTAKTFASLNIAGAARRVPIYVVGVRPASSDLTELQAIAAESAALLRRDVGGRCHRAVNLACRRPTHRSGVQPQPIHRARPGEPIVGTVNLKARATLRGLAATHRPHLGRRRPDPAAQQHDHHPASASGPDAGTTGDRASRAIRAFRTFKPVPTARGSPDTSS